MGYVGTAPLSGDYRKLDDISSGFDGSETEFTLQVGSANVTPPKETTLLISVGGILQEPVSAYTVSGSTLTFTAAPASGADFFGVLLGDTLSVGTPADDTVTGAKIVDDAIDSEHYAAASIDFAHIQNVAANSILGRNANSSGVLSEVALATTQILIGDGTGFTAAALSGDATMTNAGVVSLAAAQTTITSLLATDIKIGEDDQTKIDFEDTNTINFYANNAKEVVLIENSLSPGTASGTDLGTTSAEWGNIYIGDDKKVFFGDGQDASIEYDEDGTDQLRIAGNTIFENQIALTVDVKLFSTPADESVSGITATFTAGEALVRGEVVYFKASDTKMWKAVATAAATSRCVAMAAEDISADSNGLFLLQGFCADNGTFPTYTVGGTIYTPEAETGGENVPEQTAPDTDGDFVQVLGWAFTTSSVYFNPSNDIIEHA
tara:strand:- start:469 stop:1776 length:1308 start_codon:yes stop_codon:yes gene_type:complete